jgi:chromosome segregation ATPase
MKKIKKPNKKIQKVFTESQVGALVEEFNDNIKIVSENLIGLNDRFENFKDETRDNFKIVSGQIMRMDDRLDNVESRLNSIDNRLNNMDNRLDNVEARLDSIESDIHEIKEKLDQKADKQWVKKRIVFLEKELSRLKVVVDKM